MTCVGPSSPVFKRNKADFAKPSDAQKTAVLLALSVAELKIRQSAAPWTFAACSKSSPSSCSSSPRSTCPPAEAFARHLQLECQPRVAQRPALADRLARLDVVRKTPPATARWFHRLFRRHLWAKVIAVARRRYCFRFDVIYGQKVIYDARAERCARCSDCKKKRPAARVALARATSIVGPSSVLAPGGM